MPSVLEKSIEAWGNFFFNAGTTTSNANKKREYSALLTSRYNKKYLDFINKPPKSFFKKLFVRTELRKSLIIKSKDKVLPKGLKNEKVERIKIERPPIPYIPVPDPNGDALKDSAGTKCF